jgi:uncharacterized MnhB-related membrane protein
MIDVAMTAAMIGATITTIAVMIIVIGVSKTTLEAAEPQPNNG